MGPNEGSVAMNSGDLRCREGKLDFAEKNKCKTVLLRLSLAGNLEKNTYVSLWDRMEGAWLWTLNTTDELSTKIVFLNFFDA
jgi:hypothetical protein